MNSLTIRSLAHSAAARWFALPICVGLGVWYIGPRSPSPPFSPATTFTSWTSPAPLSISQPVDKEFTVASGYTTQSGLLLLTDRPNYRDPEAVTVVVDVTRVTNVGRDARALVGRTIVVKGHTSTYKGKPQISADQVTLK